MKAWFHTSVLAILLSGMTAKAAETVLVEGSVAEDASIGLAGVAYKVTYDDSTGLITFKGREAQPAPTGAK